MTIPCPCTFKPKGKWANCQKLKAVANAVKRRDFSSSGIA